MIVKNQLSEKYLVMNNQKTIYDYSNMNNQLNYSKRNK